MNSSENKYTVCDGFNTSNIFKKKKLKKILNNKKCNKHYNYSKEIKLEIKMKIKDEKQAHNDIFYNHT